MFPNKKGAVHPVPQFLLPDALVQRKAFSLGVGGKGPQPPSPSPVLLTVASTSSVWPWLARCNLVSCTPSVSTLRDAFSDVDLGYWQLLPHPLPSPLSRSRSLVNTLVHHCCCWQANKKRKRGDFFPSLCFLGKSRGMSSCPLAPQHLWKRPPAAHPKGREKSIKPDV